MFFTYQLFRCPHCKKFLFYRIVKFWDLIKGNSGLGPSVISCAKCGTIITTGNVEWPNMSARAKIYLWFLTLVYSLVLGLMLSLLILGSIEAIFRSSQSNILSTPTFIISALLIAVPFIILQMIRIESSIIRVKENKAEPYKASFFDLNTNFQSLGMALLIIIMIIAFALYLFT